ncbi:hypothetical protein [Pseudorhodoplanes sp.]
MRMVAGCFIALLALVMYDDAMHGGRYRTGVSSMVGHMMHVSWNR